MPKLSTKTRTIELPSFEGSKVEIYDSPPYGVLKDVKQNEDPMDIAQRVLPRVIVSWNFTDEEGNDIQPNTDNIDKLPMKDVNMLLEEAMKNAESDLKKKTSDE